MFVTSSLVSLQEISKVLRRTEEQIMVLVAEKKIPYNTTHEGVYLFPLETVLLKIAPLEVEVPVVTPVVLAFEEVTVGLPADKPSEKKPVTSTKKRRK